MAKITEFTRQTLKGFQADVEAAVTAVALKYGVAVKGGSGSFTASTFTKKFEFFTGAEKGESGTDLKYKANITYADMFGMPRLKENDYNKVFSSGPQCFRFVGINTKGRKFPIIAQSLTTKKYHKFTDAVADKIANSKTWHNK